jgi:hypothetical protein
VQIDRDFRLLQPEILDIIRKTQSERELMLANGTSIRPGYYTTDDLERLPRDRLGAYIAEHERLKELGLNGVTPIAWKRENYIGVLPGRADIVRGFDEKLRERINAKADVLGEVGDLQRHLAVVVLRWDFPAIPNRWRFLNYLRRSTSCGSCIDGDMSVTGRRSGWRGVGHRLGASTYKNDPTGLHGRLAVRRGLQVRPAARSSY